MTATNGNPPTDEPMTAEACLTEAIANLRQAEQAWPDNRVSDAAVRNVVDIARGWVLAAAETRAIAASHFWDDKPKPAPRPDIDALEFPKGMYAITAAQLDDLGLCVDESGEFRPITDKPMTVRRAGAWAADEQSRAAFKTHRFSSISGPCARCDVLPDIVLQNATECVPVSTHVHTEQCRHQWIRPGEPCRNNCGTGSFSTPRDADTAGNCPAACPDVNA